MFAQKYNYWNDCNSTHSSYQPYQYTDHLRPHAADAAFPYNTNPNPLSPASPTCSKTDYAQEYLKELLEKIEKEKYQKQEVIPPVVSTVTTVGGGGGGGGAESVKATSHHYNNCIVNTSTFYTCDPTPPQAPSLPPPTPETPLTPDSRVNTPVSVDNCKRSAILSRFYKPDGTPVKGLWDNEANSKEQRQYKYEPKPLERRKTPRSFVPDEKKSQEYWEKRRKNNVAARKSREDRRKKEIETLKNVDNLKNDNIKLKIYAQKVMTENQNLKYEINMLKRL